MFLLFRVMNGDQTPMEPLLHGWQLQILFILFMVISNWMVLAILTAVVSENMLFATNQFMKMEKEEDFQTKKAESTERLMALFKEIDKDGDVTIDSSEFHQLLEDKGLRDEFCDATSLKERDLKDLFSFLSHEQGDGKWRIDYELFIDKLQDESKDVSERSVFRLERQMRLLETRIDAKLERMREEIQEINHLHDPFGRARHYPGGKRSGGQNGQVRNRRPEGNRDPGYHRGDHPDFQNQSRRPRGNRNRY